jgi:hypothetical protein
MNFIGSGLLKIQKVPLSGTLCLFYKDIVLMVTIKSVILSESAVIEFHPHAFDVFPALIFQHVNHLFFSEPVHEKLVLNSLDPEIIFAVDLCDLNVKITSAEIIPVVEAVGIPVFLETVIVDLDISVVSVIAVVSVTVILLVS